MVNLSVKDIKEIERRTGKNILNINTKLEKKKEKYNSEKCYFGGIEFRSKLEKERYIFLDMCKRLGLIKEFEYEKDKFTLIDTQRLNNKYEKQTIKKTTYTPDFKVELNNGDIIFEDTKSESTRKKESYVIKKKLFIQKFCSGNIYFKEIFHKEEKYF